jgi:hypothetical protein
MRTTGKVRAGVLAALVLGAASAAAAGQDAGTDATFKWFSSNDPFRWTPVYQFPTTTNGVHTGFSWPVSDPVKTAMFSGVGASYFNQGLDNLVCWGYNANCSGPFNRSEHFFNIVLEGSYDEDPAAGTDFGQNWVEVNWNYGAAGVTCPAVPTEQDGCWRPFGFVLDEGLNSTRGGAMWFFNANDEEKGDNTSLALSWPWAAFGTHVNHDMWYDSGLSSFTRSSTFDPGGTAYGIKGRFYLDHTNARSGPHQIGIDMLTDYSSTDSAARAGGIIGGRFTAKTSGWTSGRDAVFMDGLHVNLEATSTGTGMTLQSGYAIRAHHDFSGQSVAFTSTAGLYVDQPTAPGTFTTTGSHYGVLIEDQRFDRGGMDNGQAIAVKPQTTSNGSEGNIHMAGGTHNTGHVQLASDHLWADTSNNRLRFKNDAAPTSATDGKYLVMGGTGGGHGPVGWAQAGVACATACSFMGGSCQNSVCLEQLNGSSCNQTLKQVACTTTDAKRMCLCN